MFIVMFSSKVLLVNCIHKPQIIMHVKFIDAIVVPVIAGLNNVNRYSA
jgi:hypothetical protein